MIDQKLKLIKSEIMLQKISISNKWIIFITSKNPEKRYHGFHKKAA